MNASISIALADKNDASGIAWVNYTAWNETYRGIIHDHFIDSISLHQYTKRWQSILHKQKPNSFVLTIKNTLGAIIGYCSGGTVRESFQNAKGEIYSLYLLRQYQGAGLGGQLFKQGVLRLNELGFDSFCVFVLEQNPTINFYRHFHPDFEDTDVVHIGEEDYDDVGFGWNSFKKFM